MNVNPSIQPSCDIVAIVGAFPPGAGAFPAAAPYGCAAPGSEISPRAEPDEVRHAAARPVSTMREEAPCVGVRRHDGAVHGVEPGARQAAARERVEVGVPAPTCVALDRKSTRLNSSHLGIS